MPPFSTVPAASASPVEMSGTHPSQEPAQLSDAAPLMIVGEGTNEIQRYVVAAQLV